MGAQCSCAEQCVTSEVTQDFNPDFPVTLSEHIPTLGAGAGAASGARPALVEVHRLSTACAVEDASPEEAATHAPSAASSTVGASTFREDLRLLRSARCPSSEEGQEPSARSEADKALPNLLQSKYAAADTGNQPGDGFGFGRKLQDQKARDVIAEFRVCVERESAEEFLGLDVRRCATLGAPEGCGGAGEEGEGGGSLEVASVDAEGLAALTGMFKLGDVIVRVNDAESSEDMIAECVEASDLVFYVVRPRDGPKRRPVPSPDAAADASGAGAAGGAPASGQAHLAPKCTKTGGSRPTLPPLKLPVR